MNGTYGMSSDEKIGQLIFFGFEGYECTEEVKALIAEYHIGNVILFTRNFKNLQQFTRLIADLQAEAMRANGVAMLVALDQEGGSVTRLTHDFTFPSGAMATAAAGGGEDAYVMGKVIAMQMQAVGANLNLAPEIDLAGEAKSAHINSRGYAATADAARDYITQFITATQEYVIATAKHFPGIGASEVDLHLSLGRNKRTIEQLNTSELATVRDAIDCGVKAVMSSHEVYTALDNLPATLSYKINTQLLRKEYGFTGLLISDCMEMKALAGAYGTANGCVMAVKAGVDMLLICHTRETQIESINALKAAVSAGDISADRLNSAVERILCAKAEIKPAQPEKLPALIAQGDRISEDICARALTAMGEKDFFVSCVQCKTLFVAPRPAALTMADETAAALGACAAVKQAGLAHCVYEYSLPISAQELEHIHTLIDEGKYDKVIIGVYNARNDEGQRALLNWALASRALVGVIAMRSPYDMRFARGSKAGIYMYDYTPPMVRALVRAMAAKTKITGRLPITI